MQLALELDVLQVEGVLAVGQRRVALQEEGMGRITDNVVVGILTTLGGDHLGRELVIRLPQLEVGADIARVADLLERHHVRPERIDETLLILLQRLAQLEAHVEQEFFLVLLIAAAEVLRVVEGLKDVIRHGMDIQPWLRVGFRDPLHDTLETGFVQDIFCKLEPFIGTGHG